MIITVIIMNGGSMMFMNIGVRWLPIMAAMMTAITATMVAMMMPPMLVAL